MSSMEFDPLTGLPKQQGGAAYPGAPVFGTTAPFSTTGGTGYASTGGTGTGGAWTPADFQKALEADPLYKQSLADITAASVADRAGLKGARQQAIIRFGYDDLGGLGDLGGDIDETTLNLARQNTQAGTSVGSRITKAHADAMRMMKNALAARGMLRSGELGHQVGELDLSRRQGDYDARQTLVQALSGYAAGFAQAEQARAMQRAAAAGGAAGRFPPTGGGGGGGPQPPAPQAEGGQQAVPPPPPNFYGLEYEHPTMRRGRIL